MKAICPCFGTKEYDMTSTKCKHCQFQKKCGRGQKVTTNKLKRLLK